MQSRSLRFRVTSFTLAPTLIIGILLSAYFTIDSYNELENQLIESGFNISKPLAIAGEYSIKSQKYDVLKQIINYTHRKHSNVIRSITIFDVSREVYITSSFEADVDNYIDDHHDNETSENTISHIESDRNTLILKSPIFSDGQFLKELNNTIQPRQVIGYIVIDLDLSYLRLQQYQEVFIASLVLCFGIILSLFFAYRLVNEVNKPISQMVEVVDKLRRGQLASRVNGDFKGELETLKNGINEMASSLSDHHHELQEDVEQATADLRETLEQLEVQNIELDIAKKSAQEAARVKTEFLANMSHELRTPLNGVIGFTRQMLKTPLTTNQIDYLQTIERSAKSLLEIINDILDFSKIEAGKILIENIPFNIQDTIEEILILQAPSAHEKGLEITLDIDSNIPNYIIGDQLKIKQVMTNLVGNGIKFTQRGHIYIQVSIEYIEQDNVALAFSVKDTGNGISERQQEQLFQAFNQGDASISRRYGGTGLGLIITQNLINRMGGHINLESKLHQGSHFWFTLPFKIANASEIPENIASIEGHDITPLAGKSVLIIGSNYQAAEVLKQQALTLGMIPTHHQQLEISLFVDTQQSFYDVILLNIAAKLPLVEQTIEEKIQLAINHTNNLIVGLPSTALAFSEKIEEKYGVLSLPKPIFYSKLIRSMLNPDRQFTLPQTVIPTQHDKLDIHVLAVDDNQANLKLVKALLEEQVSEISTCESGFQAIEQAQLHKFDVILMDIQMPEMDGVTACQSIRTAGLNQNTPIIAVTANIMKGEKERLLSLGMNDYLAKPIDDRKLKKALAQYTHADSEQTLLVIDDNNLNSLNNMATLTIDWPQAISLSAHNESLAKEMLQGLVDQFPALSNTIDQTLEDTNALVEPLIDQVHKVHGSAAYCGTRPLKKLCATIETALRSGSSAKEIEAELFELQDEMEKVTKEAEKYLG